jgi:hypothetical protein
MKNHILRLTPIIVLFASATALAQSPMYPQQVPPTPTADVPISPAQAQQSQYNQSLPPTNLAPYSPTPYSPAPGSAAPYSQPPYGPPSYTPAPSGPTYSPAPYTPAPYTSAPYGPPAYTPAPGARASYDGPPAYTPAPYSSSPYGTTENIPAPYTPAPYTPAPYTPAPNGPPAYTPAPSGPPVYTPAPMERLPSGALEGPRWIFSADALFLERSAGSSVFLGGTYTNPGSANIDNLYSDDELFPLETGVRLQFGRRFTDDIAVDAIYWGLQQWSVGRNIYGDPVGETVLAFSPWTQTDALIGGFDNYLGYTDKSQVNNFEINERIMLNEHDPYHSLAWLWGFRYFQLSDNFTLTGSDDFTGDYENIDWKTQNELLGLQAGLQWTRGWDRFQVVTEGKAGLYANIYSQKGNNLDSSGVGGNPAGFVPFDVSHNGTDVAGLFELSVLAKYRLNDFLWLRLGYQGYAMTGLALGARQLGGYSHGGTVAFDGPSIGLDATW